LGTVRVTLEGRQAQELPDHSSVGVGDGGKAMAQARSKRKTRGKWWKRVTNGGEMVPRGNCQYQSGMQLLKLSIK